MSHSHRQTPICGITAAVSEKKDKRFWHRRFRHRNRQRIRAGHEPLSVREVIDLWDMAKEGKKHFTPQRYPRLMRK